MSGLNEPQVQAVVKAKKLPMIKKIIMPEYELLWFEMLEVVTGSGVAHSYWMKLYNGLWDNNSGVFRGYEPHEGSKNIYYIKKKVFNDMLSAFTKKYDKDVENQFESLPSFIMAKNTYDE